MIPQDFISEWKKAAPWSQNDQVEQDLIICRALVAEFEQNLCEKLGDPRFIADIGPLVVADSGFDPAMAAEFVLKRLAILIPGEPWKGKTSVVMPSLTKAAE